MPQKSEGCFVIANEKGLHTRPSIVLMKCATAFRSRVFLQYQNCIVDAKSLLSIVLLCAVKGAKIQVSAEGEDAEAAVRSIVDLARNNFDISY